MSDVTCAYMRCLRSTRVMTRWTRDRIQQINFSPGYLPFSYTYFYLNSCLGSANLEFIIAGEARILREHARHGQIADPLSVNRSVWIVAYYRPQMRILKLCRSGCGAVMTGYATIASIGVYDSVLVYHRSRSGCCNLICSLLKIKH